MRATRTDGPATEIMKAEEEKAGRVRLQYGSDLTRDVNRR